MRRAWTATLALLVGTVLLAAPAAAQPDRPPRSPGDRSSGRSREEAGGAGGSGSNADPGAGAEPGPESGPVSGPASVTGSGAERRSPSGSGSDTDSAPEAGADSDAGARRGRPAARSRVSSAPADDDDGGGLGVSTAPADRDEARNGEGADHVGGSGVAIDADEAAATREAAAADATDAAPMAPLAPPPSPWEDAPRSADAQDGDAPETEEAVRADGSPPASAEVREPGEAPSIPRREVPDYDHRAEAGTTAEEALLWVPRVLFFPVHLVFEYVLRQPIGWFVTTAERERWPLILFDIVTWDERRAGLVPTAFFDFGFLPSVGLYFWWNDFLAEGNEFRAQIGFGGVDWLRATVADRFRPSEETEIGFTVDAWRRPDQVFQGLGYDSNRAQRARYRLNTVETRLDFRFRPWRASEIRFRTGVRWTDFEDDGYAFFRDDPSVGEAVRDQGWYELPPGFDGYTAYTQRLDVVIDSRQPRPAPGHGVRLEGFVEQGFDVTDVDDNRWLKYGAALGGFVDLSDNRVLGLWGVARFADPLAGEPVPFLEQVQLGGDAHTMWGFLPGQLVGRSAAVVTLEYRYPIWVFLDGALHVSLGNVFDEHLSDFDVERLRASFGIGLRSIGDRDQTFNVMLAFGTAPFDRGGAIDSIRLVVGSRQGF